LASMSHTRHGRWMDRQCRGSGVSTTSGLVLAIGPGPTLSSHQSGTSSSGGSDSSSGGIVPEVGTIKLGPVEFGPGEVGVAEVCAAEIESRRTTAGFDPSRPMLGQCEALAVLLKADIHIYA
jgi:hypothetical protein